MKKIYAIAFAGCFTFLNSAIAQEHKHCFTTEMYNKKMLEHPVEMKQSEDQLEAFTRNYEQTHGNQRLTNTVLIIPVVFHIIHNYGPENIGDAQIRDAVAVMNRDYRKLNADTSALIPAYQGLATDIEVEFRLASIDPAGNCTNGIDRVQSYRTHNADDYSKLNPWPNNMYLNIWTVADFGPNHEGAAAYSYYPNNAIPDGEDGVISLSSYVGSMGTSNVNNSRTLTHEVGHFFNLQHPWGNTNQPGVACGDDGVNDTPVTKGWDFCPGSNYDICTPGVDENFQNYMDYSYCDVMFTAGQKTRMIAALNSTVQNRNNLWLSTNLIATGTNGASLQACAPMVDFAPEALHICAGDSIRFLSGTHNADTLTYSWSFPSGSPATSTLVAPYVTYSTPGVYSATLTVTSPGGSDAITKSNILTVLGGATLAPIYSDDFETVGTFPGTTGYVENPDVSTLYKWNRISGIVGSSGVAAIKMRNSGTNHVGEFDSWITDAFDLTQHSGVMLKYKLAYSNYNTQKIETLRIYYSTNCGRTWNLRLAKSGASLATTTAFSNFTPSSAAQWRQETVTLGAGNNKPNVRFKFEFESGGTDASPYGDNNLYIDDIQVVGTPLGIDEINRENLSLAVSPNPTSGNTNISFSTPDLSDVEVLVFDLMGQEVMTVNRNGLPSGSYEFSINTSTLAKGVYFIQLKAGQVSDSQKLIVQ
ncbi:MAG: M43 family zinc metalloprotease [Bacteroidota bacterium]